MKGFILTMLLSNVQINGRSFTKLAQQKVYRILQVRTPNQEQEIADKNRQLPF